MRSVLTQRAEDFVMVPGPRAAPPDALAITELQVVAVAFAHALLTICCSAKCRLTLCLTDPFGVDISQFVCSPSIGPR